MSKKIFAVLSVSLMTLAACAAPNDVADDTLPPSDDFVIDDLFFDDADLIEPSIEWEEEEELFLEDAEAQDDVLLLDAEAEVLIQE